jgi:S1-C subfamily serine protease
MRRRDTGMIESGSRGFMRIVSRLVAALVVALLAGACSISADVYGVVGEDGEIFTGRATGYADRTGTISLSNGKVTDCIGQFRYTGMNTGVGLLTCNDGQRATIQFNALGMASGYGFGVSTAGRPVKFTYGLSREESAQYIGQQAAAPQAGATPPAGAAPGPTPAASRRATTGSGFFISRQGHVLTNAHVVARCSNITVQRAGSAAMPANLVSSDTANDLALLQVTTSPAAIATFRAGRPVRQGESVVAYGFPLTGALATGGVLTTGSVNALSGTRDDIRFLQISAPIQPGNSGGPVFDSSGLIIGVATKSLEARTMQLQNINFAIKNDVVRTFTEVAGVGLETAAGGREMTAADVGERARAFTVMVECLR